MNSAALYVAICGAATLTGLGVLRVLQVPRHSGDVLLAPAFAVAIWALVIGIAVAFGLPVERFRTAVWVLSAVLCVAGIGRIGTAGLRDNAMHIAVAGGVAAAVMAGYLYDGLAAFPGSPAYDGWSYISYGEYLNRYPKGTEGGLAPLYQYAAHLAHTRYIASAMLALLIPPGCAACDTQSSVGAFLAVASFAFSAACMYAGRSSFARTPVVVFYGVLCVAGGWLIGALRVNNFDNMLALPIMPAAVGLVLMSGTAPRQYLLGLAVLVAAAVYIYPELLPLFAIGVALAVANAAYRDGQGRQHVLFGLAAIFIALVLVTPFGSDLAWFFRNQLGAASASSGPRPGEGMFPALLDWRMLPITMWGFEPLAWPEFEIYGALALIGLAGLAAGCAVAWRRRLIAIPVIAAIAMILSLVMVLGYRYDYGAYKMLLYGWWAIALTTVLGLQALDDRMATARLMSHRAWRVLRTVSLFLVMGVFANGIVCFYRGIPEKSIEPYRELQAIDRITGGAPLEVRVGQDVPNLWAVYFLRDSTARFSEYRVYMNQAHVQPFMARSKAATFSRPEFVLTDRAQVLAYERVWENSRYRLWRTRGGRMVAIEQIVAPNGMEVLDGEPYFWIGTIGATARIYAEEPDRVELAFELRPGPELEQLPAPHTLAVSVNGANSPAVLIDGVKEVRIPVTLRPGANHLVLAIPNETDIPKPQRSDTRILLGGVRNLRLLSRPANAND